MRHDDYRLHFDVRPDGRIRVRVAGPDGQRIRWQFVHEQRAVAERIGQEKILELLAGPPPPALADIAIPANGAAPSDEPVLVIPDPNLLIMSDLHVPHHHRIMLQRAIYVATRHPRVRSIAILGDLFDFANLSRHPHNAPEEMANEEIKIAGQVLRALLTYFDHAYICNGNHDERLARRVDAHLGLQFLIDGALGAKRPDCEIHITNLDYMLVDSPDGDARTGWLMGHPAGYSGIGGRMPSEIADLAQRNVITAHNHIIGVAQSRSGRYLGIDIGHMSEPERHYYQRRRLTKFTRWNAGFGLMLDGYVTPYYERFTNWRALGC